MKTPQPVLPLLLSGWVRKSPNICWNDHLLTSFLFTPVRKFALSRTQPINYSWQARLWACGHRDVSTPSFGCHLNPIPTRVGQIMPTIYWCLQQVLKATGAPARYFLMFYLPIPGPLISNLSTVVCFVLFDFKLFSTYISFVNAVFSITCKKDWSSVWRPNS